MFKESVMEKIAVLIPCHNEERTVGTVVRDFRTALPNARIFVYDNASTDLTADCAKDAGAEVVSVSSRGKGNVVRAMFERVDADICVLVDGDDTYFAKDAPALIDAVRNGCDMAVGVRRPVDAVAMRPVNFAGNRFFSVIIGACCGMRLRDVLSGYRVFSREFVERVPVLSLEFEIEAELTFQAITKQFSVREIDVDYKQRPEGSKSKLNVLRDGFVILSAVLMLLRDTKPLTFFGLCALLCWSFSVSYGFYVYILERAADLMDLTLIGATFALGTLFVFSGVILSAMERRFRELHAMVRKTGLRRDV
jgi:glycosyltransferase involved in cell wall biosynthesis